VTRTPDRARRAERQEAVGLRRDPNAILELWPPPEADSAAAAAKEEIWAAESVCYLRRLIQD
jgi:hypothetical protein